MTQSVASRRNKLPERLHGAPALALDHAWRASGGDWRRVTWDGTALTVHNDTTFTHAELPQQAPEQRVWHMGSKPRRNRVIGADRSEENMNTVFHRAHMKDAS